MKTLMLAISLTTLILPAFGLTVLAQETAKQSRFTRCLDQWKEKKAAPDYRRVKFGYREHMRACLERPNFGLRAPKAPAS